MSFKADFSYRARPGDRLRVVYWIDYLNTDNEPDALDFNLEGVRNKILEAWQNQPGLTNVEVRGWAPNKPPFFRVTNVVIDAQITDRPPTVPLIVRSAFPSPWVSQTQTGLMFRLKSAWVVVHSPGESFESLSATFGETTADFVRDTAKKAEETAGKIVAAVPTRVYLAFGLIAAMAVGTIVVGNRVFPVR